MSKYFTQVNIPNFKLHLENKFYFTNHPFGFSYTTYWSILNIPKDNKTKNRWNIWFYLPKIVNLLRLLKQMKKQSIYTAYKIHKSYRHV